MPEIYIDEPSASRYMREIKYEAQSVQQAHVAEVPYFPATAAGLGFEGFGSRLQRAFDVVHERGTTRIAAIAATAQAAVEQFEVVAQADEQFGAAVSKVGD